MKLLMILMAALLPYSAFGESMIAPVKQPPVIGISGKPGSKSVAAMEEKFRKAQVKTVVLSNHEKVNALFGGVKNAVKRDLQMIDALVVMGNDYDIDPAKYGQKVHPTTKVETDLARAEYEEEMLRQAIAMKMPVLGVCGGHQRINVLKGGNLRQSVAEEVGDNRNMQTDGPATAVQYVSIKEGTLLDHIADEIPGLYTPDYVQPGQLAAANDERDMVNSFHRQAVGRVADGFIVSASSDGVIPEAIEPDPNGPYKDQFILGVQWHPEFLQNELSKNIVDHVAAEGAKFAKEHQREKPLDIDKQIESRNALSQPVEEEKRPEKPENAADNINSSSLDPKQHHKVRPVLGKYTARESRRGGEMTLGA